MQKNKGNDRLAVAPFLVDSSNDTFLLDMVLHFVSA